MGLTRVVSLSIRVCSDCEQFVSCVVLCRGVRLSVSRVRLSDGDCPSFPDLRTCHEINSESCPNLSKSV